MRVIVTRPQREAERWSHELQVRGLTVLTLPLIAITAVTDTAQVLHTWQQLEVYGAVMFVSANAVHEFFAAKPVGAHAFDRQARPAIRVWATGPATAKALLRAGVAADLVDAPAPGSPFDSEALWPRVAHQLGAGQRLLIVRGYDSGLSTNPATRTGQGNGRDWLAQQARALGVQVDFVAAYQRAVPQWSPAQLELARQAAFDGSVWLFGSSQALTNLKLLLPQQGWQRARALVTHARIAAAARSAGFGRVTESGASLPEVVSTLKSGG